MEPEDSFEEIEEGLELEPELEQKKERPLWKKILGYSLRAAIGLAVIAGLIYLSGPRQFFFYRKTPEDIKAEKMESVLQAEQIEIPIWARIIQVQSSPKGSDRDQDDILRLVEQANRIWAQADISLEIKGIKKISMTKQDLESFTESPYQFSKQLENFDPGLINTFFIGNLEGPSGLAYTSSRNILIADYTTAHDFLVFAHEIGHGLGLSHVSSDEDNLMFPEANSPHLSKQQIIEARRWAKEITTEK